MTDRVRGLLTALLLTACAVPAAALTPVESRGKAIYFGGIGAGGRPLQAYLAGSAEPVEADAVPCAGCHGEDGRGRSEGGIVPGDITWSNLTKPYGHTHGAGRKHPAFSDRSLAAAVTRGVDPAGNPLDPVMPRYLLNRADLAALTAYLQRIESDPPPGVSGASLRLGVVLPLAGPFESTGRDLQALLTAYADDLNARGGIYNRRLELVIADAAASRQQTLANVRPLISATPVLAVIGALIPAHETAVADLLENAGVPLIGAVADFPHSTGRSGFYLADGLTVRLQALLQRAGEGLLPAAPRLALVHSGRADDSLLRQSLAATAAANGWPQPLAPGDDGAGIAPDAVIFVGTDSELTGWIATRPEPARPLYLFLPTAAALGGVLFDLPPAVAARVLLAVPFPPPDPAGEATAGLRAWQRKAGVGDRSLYAEALALAAIKVLVEGLKRAGSELSRSKLVAALEGLRDLDAAPMPPMSFSSSRHIGGPGVSVLAIDAEHRRYREAGASNPAP